MKKYLYFIAGAATAIIARPYVGPAFQQGVRFALRSLEAAQRDLERSEAAAAKAAAAPPPAASGAVATMHPAAGVSEPERRLPVSIVGSNA